VDFCLPVAVQLVLCMGHVALYGQANKLIAASETNNSTAVPKNATRTALLFFGIALSFNDRLHEQKVMGLWNRGSSRQQMCLVNY
jgi:hypothetical protein